MKVSILNWNKNKEGEVSLDPVVFEQKVRLDLLSHIVRWQLAKRRQGSHHAKTRAEVSGGGIKPFRQKGTGRARQGSIRSPLLRSGGKSFGPKNRDYSTKLPAKIRKFGIKSALSYCVSKDHLFVVQDMASSKGKTKELSQRLKKFGLKKALLVDHKKEDSFARACRNIPSYQLAEVKGLNVYDILKYENVVLTKSALEEVHKTYGEKKI